MISFWKRSRSQRGRLLDRLFDPALDQRTGWMGLGLRVLRTLYLAYRKFLDDFCWDRAAALTFATIISLLPTAVLVLNLFSLFVEDHELRKFAREKVDQYLTLPAPPGALESRGSPPEGAAPAPPGPRGQLDTASRPSGLEGGAATRSATSGEEPARDIRVVLHDWIDQYIRRDILQVNVQKNLVLFLVLVFSSLALLVSAERVFNRIWKVHGTRTYFQKFVAFWMILTTSPLLVAASFFIDGLTGQGTTIYSLMSRYSVLAFFYRFLVPLLISCVAFSLLNLFLPRTRVRFLAAVLGGLFSGILWLVLKENFYLYMERAAQMRSFYGSLAVIPVFLVFVYLTWLIILGGAELAFTAQHYRNLVRGQRLDERARTYSLPYVGLYLLGRIMEAYRNGPALPTVHDIADELDVEIREVETVVDALTRLDVLRESVTDDGTCFLPARDPRSVPLRGVVTALLELEWREESDGGEPSGRGTEVRDLVVLHGRARDAYLEVFDELKLDDLPRPGALRDAPAEPEKGEPGTRERASRGALVPDGDVG